MTTVIDITAYLQEFSEDIPAVRAFLSGDECVDAEFWRDTSNKIETDYVPPWRMKVSLPEDEQFTRGSTPHIRTILSGDQMGFRWKYIVWSTWAKTRYCLEFPDSSVAARYLMKFGGNVIYDDSN